MKFSKENRIKYIISGILAVIIYMFLIQPILQTFMYGFKLVKDQPEKYMWLFNDSIKLENKFGRPEFVSVTGRERKSDNYYSYNLEGGYHVHIFEFKDLNGISISDIKFNFNNNYKSFKNRRVIILNKDVGNWPIISFKFKDSSLLLN